MSGRDELSVAARSAADLLYRLRCSEGVQSFHEDWIDDIDAAIAVVENSDRRQDGGQAEQWQVMAEGLWEELQCWHYDDCPTQDHLDEKCTCHRILAAKWDELTAAQSEATA